MRLILLYLQVVSQVAVWIMEWEWLFWAFLTPPMLNHSFLCILLFHLYEHAILNEIPLTAKLIFKFRSVKKLTLTAVLTHKHVKIKLKCKS